MPPAVVVIAKVREVAGNVSSKQRVAVNEVKTEAEKGVLSGAPFFIFVKRCRLWPGVGRAVWVGPVILAAVFVFVSLCEISFGQGEGSERSVSG